MNDPSRSGKPYGVGVVRIIRDALLDAMNEARKVEKNRIEPRRTCGLRQTTEPTQKKLRLDPLLSRLIE
jgi:hypothetical protein